jgi:hypothetical protein
MIRCARCGYAEDVHVLRDKKLRCPVCVCGERAVDHPAECITPTPLLEFAISGVVIWHCPGKDTQLRHGQLKPSPPVDPATWREIIARDTAERHRVSDAAKQVYVPPVVLAPLVPARPPASPLEFAGYGGRQAVGLGRKAIDAGWDVSPWYWKAGDGGEGCAVRLTKGPLRAVATWSRKPAAAGTKSGWSADLAYAWRSDVPGFPQEVTHTRLEELLT